MLALSEAGLDVSVPFGENTRYDLVLDCDGTLTRVQCKTGRLRDGTIHFATASTYRHHVSPKTIRRDYRGEIDAFAVYCPDTGGVYMIPIGDVRTRAGAYLRVAPARNSQRRGVRLAESYRIASIEVSAHPGGDER